MRARGAAERLDHPHQLAWFCAAAMAEFCTAVDRVVSVDVIEVSKTEENCVNFMSIPGVGPVISTALVAAVGKGEAFDRGRDLAEWVGLVPCQFSTGGRSMNRKWRYEQAKHASQNR